MSCVRQELVNVSIITFTSFTNYKICKCVVELHLCDVDCACAGSRQARNQVNYFYVRAPEEYINGSQTAWLGVTGTLVIIR